MEQLEIAGFKPFMKSYRPRPTSFDAGVLRKTAEELVKRVIETGEEFWAENFDEMVEDVLEEISGYSSGYQICRSLEDRGWWIDGSELVDVFDHMPAIRQRHHRQAVKEWVVDAQVEPKLEVGARVWFQHRPSNKRVEGEVTSVYRETAEYVVYCESLGHVRSGNGTRGLVLGFEDCEEVK